MTVWLLEMVPKISSSGVYSPNLSPTLQFQTPLTPGLVIPIVKVDTVYPLVPWARVDKWLTSRTFCESDLNSSCDWDSIGLMGGDTSIENVQMVSPTCIAIVFYFQKTDWPNRKIHFMVLGSRAGPVAMGLLASTSGAWWDVDLACWLFLCSITWRNISFENVPFPVRHDSSPDNDPCWLGSLYQIYITQKYVSAYFMRRSEY